MSALLNKKIYLKIHHSFKTTTKTCYRDSYFFFHNMQVSFLKHMSSVEVIHSFAAFLSPVTTVRPG